MTDAAQSPAETVDGEASALASGIILDELDAGIRPQDDLVRHVNGKWVSRTEIPADQASADG